MEKLKFKNVAMTENNILWKQMTERFSKLYDREGEVRSAFGRDYTRILHCQAYRRLKHKTQVFFNIENDHICTRMEHVSHVESVSYTIAHALGLNTELTRAIAVGHDLGHAPFGHHGETILSEIINKKFWHEQNGLRFVDYIELLEDAEGKCWNLSLTFCVRDGIITHCGEVDQHTLIPRKWDETFNLYNIEQGGEIQPITWEACVVKIADKIAYLGRDIEDAIRLGFIEQDYIPKLKNKNTTFLIHQFITDICNNSSPERGICMSESSSELMKSVKEFNYKYIYNNERLNFYKKYSELVLKSLFEKLYSFYENNKVNWSKMKSEHKFFPKLITSYIEYILLYCDDNYIKDTFDDNFLDKIKNLNNEKIYKNIDNEEIFIQSIIDFISGMTDRFAVNMFNELISY